MVARWPTAPPVAIIGEGDPVGDEGAAVVVDRPAEAGSAAAAAASATGATDAARGVAMRDGEVLEGQRQPSTANGRTALPAAVDRQAGVA